MQRKDLFKYWNKPVALTDTNGTQWGEGQLNCLPMPGKDVQSWFLIIQTDKIFEGGVYGVWVALTDAMIDAMNPDNAGRLSVKLPRQSLV